MQKVIGTILERRKRKGGIKEWHVTINFERLVTQRFVEEFVDALKRLGPLVYKKELYDVRFRFESYSLAQNNKSLVALLTSLNYQNKYYEKKLMALIIRLCEGFKNSG